MPKTLLIQLLFLVMAFPGLAAESPARPNVVLVMADDQGWGDTGYNGHPELKTPNLDALVRSGLRFNRFYTAHFNCSPTRGSVMTGRHPNRYGTFSPGSPIRVQELTVARVLQSAGYATGHFGKWHLNGKNGDKNTTDIPGRAILVSDPLSPGKMGFGEWVSADNFFDLDPVLGRNGVPEKFHGDSSDVTTDEALKFIRRQAGTGQSFLAVVWFGSPHVPHIAPSPNERLSFACIGMGGQMRGYLVPELGKIDQQIVAICDVDKRQRDSALQVKGLANARAYHDYRELLDKEPGVDAVIIATPDHWHVPICQAALQAGKHVYCEKPLAHSVAECRALEKLAKSHLKLATQTGNQGCSTEGFRRSFEVIQSGLLGTITEVHVWHPGHAWPNGVNRPATSDPIPEGLDWNFWLGKAPARPYNNEIYHPGKWRGWYDFGGGSMADFCCHGFQLAYRALEFDAPTRIEATGDDMGHESFPTRCTVTFDFAAKGKRGPVKLHFYSGDKHLPPPHITNGPVGSTGCLIVGSEGTLSAGLWNTDCNIRLKGASDFQGANQPEVAKIAKTQPRIDTEMLKWAPKRAAKGERPRWSQVNNSHMFEWVLACAGDAKSYSPFEIGARITEVGMLGVLALRMETPIVWDAEKRQAVGLPKADAIIDPKPSTDKYLPL